jgi:hypothetical protein
VRSTDSVEEALAYLGIATRRRSMNDLFSSRRSPRPLAERLRPKAVEDMVGQRHLLGEGKPLWSRCAPAARTR